LSNPKIAVIGLGFMGAKWSRLIVENGLIDLAVVSDIRTDVGEQLASAYDAEFSPDPREAAGCRRSRGLHPRAPPRRGCHDGDRVG
jgi:3-hydroxyisobutyrate dehydrogenase-like beta-hydroxyacid dehydrogenase